METHASRRLRAAVLAAAVTLPAGVGAQEAPTRVPLEDVTVSAPRLETPLERVPASVSVVGVEDIQEGRQVLGLDESLNQVPGTYMQNRYNFAQDLRISIRGFGARAPFGIRGVKVLVDGIPATLPDGQAQVDAIDLSTVARIEVLRGPASSLYGNASGGVINIITEDGPPEPTVEGRAQVGEFGFRRQHLEAGGQQGKLNHFAGLSHLDYTGYREHSAVNSDILNTKFKYAFGPDTELMVTANAVDSPEAQDPGALTAAQVEDDPRQAHPRNLRFDAGERVREETLGARLRHRLNERHAIELRNYYTWRDFENKLPFTDGGSVQFDRLFAGAGALYTYSASLGAMPNRLMLGLELDYQRDDRRRFDNNDGLIGALTVDQLEEVTALGAFLQNELSITERLVLTAGLRYDELEFEVDDDFLADGFDDSGARTLNELSPKVGLSYRVSPRFIPYSNVSTSFESPTTTELARCTGGGFNDDVEPQTAINYEVGANGDITEAVRYNVAVFHIAIDDELIQQECPGQPGRNFFVNAGESTRDGVELALDIALTRGLRGTLAYTYSDFRFDEFRTGGDTFDGNNIPGIPRNNLHGQLKYRHPSGLYAAFEAQYVDEIYADNANDVTADDYTVANLRGGYRWSAGPLDIEAFAGVNNLFDEEYIGNVRINAFGGRFFEPAPERNAYGGLKLSYAL
ncbi:MAG: TonB-dependent receptor [Gammaproteobacteria bacterium]|nr:TonB-dependent receptor [Gammaproteobacteria bacterium]